MFSPFDAAILGVFLSHQKNDPQPPSRAIQRGDAGSGGSVAWSQEILQDFLDNIGKVDLSSYKGAPKKGQEKVGEILQMLDVNYLITTF